MTYGSLGVEARLGKQLGGVKAERGGAEKGILKDSKAIMDANNKCLKVVTWLFVKIRVTSLSSLC